MDSKDPILISKIRDRIAEEVNAHPELYDRCDADRVSRNDWSIERYLQLNKCDVDLSYHMVRDAMRWRKSYGVNARTDLDFPIEFHKIGAFFSYAVDRNGRPIIYGRIKLYKNFPKLVDVMKEFIIHIINRIDEQSQESGWGMVWDLRGAGPSNWDISFLTFIMGSLKNYYPRGMAYLLCYGVNAFMSGFVKLGLNLLNEESRSKIHILKTNELHDYIAPDNVPDFMGGKCTQSYTHVPDGAREATVVGIERGLEMAKRNGKPPNLVMNHKSPTSPTTPTIARLKGLDSTGSAPPTPSLNVNRLAYNVSQFNEDFIPIPTTTEEKIRKFKPDVSRNAWIRRLKGLLPISLWLPEYKYKENLLTDIIVGITVAIFQVPQSMGYCLIAHVPPIYGLYSAFFPALFYTLFGTGFHSAFGPF
ncbi:unnamed protein product, partial [Oppiella nova]